MISITKHTLNVAYMLGENQGKPIGIRVLPPLIPLLGLGVEFHTLHIAPAQRGRGALLLWQGDPPSTTLHPFLHQNTQKITKYTKIK